MPVFSIITPVYNGAKYLAETIESVLNQDFDKYEMIIVDDGSTDDSYKIAAKYKSEYPERIKLFSHGQGINLGVSTSRQKAISKSMGEYIYFLDADDILLSGTLISYKERFEADLEVGLIHSKVDLLSSLDNTSAYEKLFDLGQKDKKYWLSDEMYFLKQNKICNSTSSVRKSLLTDTKFSFNQMFQVEDWVLWNILSQKTMFYYRSKPAIKYRCHIDSATHRINNRNAVCKKYPRIEMCLATLGNVAPGSIQQAVLLQLRKAIANLYVEYQERNQGDLVSLILSPQTISNEILKIEKENALLREQLRNRYSLSYFFSSIFGRIISRF